MRATQGFTLIELMITVAIIAVLAVVAGTSYRKYMDNGRTTEAYMMLGEIRSRQEAYRAEMGRYVGWADAESASGYYPLVDDSSGCAEPCYKSIAGPPANWSALGINAQRSQLQCGYLVMSDQKSSGTGSNAPGTVGAQLLGATPAVTPWWYAIAVCDNDGNATTNATFVTASNTVVVSPRNEHQ